MENGHCIICHEDNVELSDEHVIPETLGGCYHVKNVCKSCNSILGRTVDINLIDFSLMELFRERYQLAGKTGKVPSFFCDCDVHLKEKPEQKMRFIPDKYGNNKLKYLPLVETNFTEDGKKIISITVDESDKEKLKEIMTNVRRRLEKSGKKVEFSEPVEYINTGVKIQGNLTIKLLKYTIGLLKIAYESLCDLFPEYEKDEYAKKISDILLNGKYKDVEQYAIFGEEIVRPFFDSCKAIQIETANKHLIYFIFIDNLGLICFVSLFDTLFLGIKMSIYNYLKNYFIYAVTNDYCNKNFEKYRFGSNGLEKI